MIHFPSAPLNMTTTPSDILNQTHLEQHHLHCNHDQRLYQQRDIVAGSRPIENLQYRGAKHDQWDIEREAGRRAGAVDGENLIRVGCQRRENQAGMSLGQSQYKARLIPEWFGEFWGGGRGSESTILGRRLRSGLRESP